MYQDGECRRSPLVPCLRKSYRWCFSQEAVQEGLAEPWPSSPYNFQNLPDNMAGQNAFLVRRLQVDGHVFASQPRSYMIYLSNCRADVAKKRKLTKNKVEVKRFRAEARACSLGDPGQNKMCKRPEGQCRMCTAIRTGFRYSLQYKRNFALQGVGYGVRFGGGLYMAPSSSKCVL